MRHLPTIARIFFGLVFLASGIAGFFVTMPPDAPEFGRALMNTGYMFQFIKVVELLCGLLLVLNRFVPLALTVLAPIVINIFAFHLFLDLKDIAPAIILAALEIYLAWVYRDSFRPMLAARAMPSGAQK
jgi:uncharacterized membrane protein YphA (DoxX/SURF4 family)